MFGYFLVLTRQRAAISICYGGFGALRRFIAFFFPHRPSSHWPRTGYVNDDADQVSSQTGHRVDLRLRNRLQATGDGQETADRRYIAEVATLKRTVHRRAAEHHGSGSRGAVPPSNGPGIAAGEFGYARDLGEVRHGHSGVSGAAGPRSGRSGSSRQADFCCRSRDCGGSGRDSALRDVRYGTVRMRVAIGTFSVRLGLRQKQLPEARNRSAIRS